LTGDEPAASCWIDNDALGGYAAGVAPDQDGAWIAVVSGFGEDFGPLGALRHHDGEALADAATPATHRVFDVAACPTGHLVTADAGGGARVYDADGDEVGDGLLDVGLPPVQLGVACY
jgi:hypothetical protein